MEYILYKGYIHIFLVLYSGPGSPVSDSSTLKDKFICLPPLSLFLAANELPTFTYTHQRYGIPQWSTWLTPDQQILVEDLWAECW